jgi:hypothetical protein
MAGSLVLAHDQAVGVAAIVPQIEPGRELLFLGLVDDACVLAHLEEVCLADWHKALDGADRLVFFRMPRDKRSVEGLRTAFGNEIPLE